MTIRNKVTKTIKWKFKRFSSRYKKYEKYDNEKKTKILLREENSHKKSFYEQLSLSGVPSHRIKPPTLNVETFTI